MDLEPNSDIGGGPVMPAGLAIFVTLAALTLGLLLNGTGHSRNRAPTGSRMEANRRRRRRRAFCGH